jgi:hypothetical protein
LNCGDGGGDESGNSSAEHLRVCQSGVARSAVGSGDIRKGIALAIQSGDQVLMKQCAALLEENKVLKPLTTNLTAMITKVFLYNL